MGQQNGVAEALGLAVALGVRVRLGVLVRVALELADDVALGVAVPVALEVDETVGLGLGVSLGVVLTVPVGLAVAVAVAVGDPVIETVPVAVAVPLGVPVQVPVTVPVEIMLELGEAVALGQVHSMRSTMKPAWPLSAAQSASTMVNQTPPHELSVKWPSWVPPLCSMDPAAQNSAQVAALGALEAHSMVPSTCRTPWRSVPHSTLASRLPSGRCRQSPGRRRAR